MKPYNPNGATTDLKTYTQSKLQVLSSFLAYNSPYLHKCIYMLVKFNLNLLLIHGKNSQLQWVTGL